MPDPKPSIEKLLDSEHSEFYERLVGTLFDAVYLVDRERRIAHWNAAAESLTGFGKQEVCGRNCADNLLMHVDERGTMLCKEGCPLQRTLRDGKPRESLVYFRHKLGHRVPVTVRTQPILDSEGKVVAAFEVFRDASQHSDFQRRIAELEGMAFLDALTRIPNRRYVETRLKGHFAELVESSGELGLILFDIDQFKTVNDRHGHQAGDAVLKSVARTLSGTLRVSDIVGRWGGEEFLAVLPNLCGDALEHLAERCRVLVASTLVPWNSDTLGVTASAGATRVRTEDDLATALARVDRLLYESKRGGRNRITIG